MTPNYKRTKLACYSAYFTMSSIFVLPPLLFATLQDMYGISYTLLGTLVLTNFCTQMIVDLLFSLFAKKFNAQMLVRVTPLITSLGLVIYALVPWLLPQQFAYAGLLAGTVIFSVAAGLSEVMLSPTIAALPSDNPQRDMSMLHSLYAFGIFFVIVTSTVFFALFDRSKWMFLTLFFAALPVIAAVLFMLSPMPDLQGGSEKERARWQRKGARKPLALAHDRSCPLRCLHLFRLLCREHHVQLDLGLYGKRAAHPQGGG